MENNDYVVLFDGLSVPQEDVHFLKPFVENTQNFFYGDDECSRYIDAENEFTKHLDKEQHILREGFLEWCEREFLDQSDDHYLDERHKFSSILTESALRNQQSQESFVEPNLVRTDEIAKKNTYEEYTGLVESSRVESDVYTCTIDESALLLTDIDYIRAKCKWYFKSVYDFERDYKVIEHMRYLELFTQLFTIRLTHELSHVQNYEQFTCYNFQGDNIKNASIEIVCLGHSAFSPALEDLPEKKLSNNNWDQRPKQEFNTDNFSTDLEDGCKTCKLQHTTAVNNIKSRSKKTYQKDNPYNVYVSSPEMKTVKKKVESVNSLETTLSASLHGIEDKTCFTNNIKENDLKDETPAGVYEDNGINSSSIEYLINKNKLRIVRQLGDRLILETKRSKHNHENCIFKENSKYSDNRRGDCNRVAGKRKTRKNKQPLPNKTCRDWTIETIRYRPAKTSESFMSNVTSVPLDSNGNKKEVSKSHNVKIENTDNRTKSAGNLATDEVDQLFSSNVIYEFIKSFKAKNSTCHSNQTDDSKESAISSGVTSTCVLDAFLKEKNGPIIKKDDAQIIIIGLKCANQKNQTDADDASEYNRLRRYIEGDNLCSPGRYAEDSRMPRELNLRNKTSENLFNNQDCLNTTNYSTVNESLQILHRAPAPDSDMESEISSSFVVNQSFTNNSSGDYSAHSSTSSEDVMKNKKKKPKRPICKHCNNNNNAFALANIRRPVLHKKNSQTIYVSCWKRFCVIL